MELEVFYNTIFKKHRVVSTDSRNITKDCLFFALKGDNFNGNKYAISSIENGAAYSIVDDSSIQHEKVICVSDVLLFMQKLANYHRKTLDIPFIGITGTNGKTTTKELLAAVLETTYKVSFTQGNLNNHIGVPLTILSIKDDTEIAIIEMGANHQGEIAFLCEIAQPNFGIITNVGKAHLEGFGSFETIVKTKTELYKSILKSKGVVFVDADNSILLEHTHGINTISYSINNSAEINGQVSLGEVCATFTLKYKDTCLHIESQLFGDYNAKNMLAAACIGIHFNVIPSNIKKALESYTPANFRSQIIKQDNNTIILDAYNANPTSMKAALTHFIGVSTKNKAAILGEMFELGADHEIEHNEIIRICKSSNLENVYLIGNWPVVKDERIKQFNSSKDFLEFIEHEKLQHKLFLVKGSRGVKLETIIPYL